MCIQSSIVYCKACMDKPPYNIILVPFSILQLLTVSVITSTITVCVTISVHTRHVAMKRLSF